MMPIKRDKLFDFSEEELVDDINETWDTNHNTSTYEYIEHTLILYLSWHVIIGPMSIRIDHLAFQNSKNIFLNYLPILPF